MRARVQAWGVISFLVPHSNIDPAGATIYNHSAVNGSVHFLQPYDVDFSLQNLKDNWGAEWEVSPQCKDKRCTFKLMFAIIFPMVGAVDGGCHGYPQPNDRDGPHLVLLQRCQMVDPF
jgi:hypothetical protein